MELLLIIVPAIICIIAQINVTSTYNRYHKIRNARGLTGAETARQILDLNGLTHVQIERVSGSLSDHYDPSANVVRLSESVYDQTSVAALGVAAHECGHAVQHAQSYAPVLIRSNLVPIVNFCSRAWYFVFILGLLATSFLGSTLLWVAVFLFAGVALFQIVTLPVEFDASRRAMQILETQGFLEGSEVSGAKKVLTAAALTYVAALLQSLAQLLRLVRAARDD
ncbi:MAG: zinc metallopeptidase [Oscillospiraceae bacterium]|jgi:Zn-dependent membrane protease YugP|nr:zinc metallopeptidase [Oscillospiraceae bacterium]